MSSLQTLPKGDSAWLLRKAVQRVMQQVSVLETNIGTSTTGNSANTQVIFNDAGTLRGDPDLIFNTATNRLVALNLEATAALQVGTNATISGDLTVDTSTLKVDSANNRVGIGTASPASVLTVQSQASARLSVRTTDAVFGTVTGGNALDSLNATDTDVVPFGVRGSTITLASSVGIVHQINASGNCTWSNVGGVAGTAMTLNSTGLGVGVSPSYKLDIAGTGNFQQLRVSNANATSIALVNTTSGLTYTLYSANTASNGFDGFGIFNGTSYDLRIVNGNVGIGVTPSAWTSAFGSVLQFKSAGSSAGGSLTGSSADNFRMFSNTYYDGAYKYIAAGFATQYEQSAGSHVWYLSGTTAGAINGTVPFSTALSLDKTGSLVLGSAAVATTATDGFLYIPSCAGAPTGVPTAKTGRVPMVVDSTNNRFYVYVSGTWKYTTLA